MYLKIFKAIPIVFLLLTLLTTQNAFAQSNIDNLLKAYEKGQLTNPTAEEKQIMSEYLESTQVPDISKERVLSPDATVFYQQKFGPSLLKENFNYAVGQLTTGSGGKWVTNTGTGNFIQVSSGSLTKTGYRSSGLYNKIDLISPSSSAEDAYTQFASQGEGTTTYTSLLLNVANTTGLALNTDLNGDYFMALLPSNSTSNYNSRIAIRTGSVANTFQLGLRASSTAAVVWSTIDLAVATTHLIVIGYQAVPGATNDVASVWINPPVDGTQPAADLTQTALTDLFDVSRFAVRQNSSSGITTPNASIDGIRIGTAWSELFPTTIPPTGWTNVSNVPNTYLWKFNNSGSRSITGNFDEDFAMMDDDIIGSGATSNTTITTSAINCATATNVSFGFDNQFRSLTGSSGTVQVSNDGTNWTTLETFTTSSGYPNPPVYKEYDVTAYAAGQSTVYFRWTYNDGATWAWWWGIDNVVVYEPDLTPLAATLVSPLNGATGVALSATLNWLAGGGAAPTGYRLYFGTDGGGVTPPTNIVNNQDLGLVTTYDPASLSYSTTYYWKIVPYNGAGNAASTPIWSFTTGPDPTITTFPYTQNFDGVTTPNLPNGWTIENTNGDANVWATSTSAPRSTPNHMRISYNSTLAMNDWFFTPPVQLTGGTSYTVKFWYRGTSFDESMEVKWGASATSAGMTEGPIFDNPSFAFTTYTEGVGTFTPSTTGTYYLGWHGYSTPDQNAIYVDDITIQETAYGTLSGTITNCFDSSPLSGATVTAGTYSATTNASGYYQIDNILTGVYDVTASKIGFVDQTVTGVTVLETGTTQNFCLNELLSPPVNLQASVTGQDVSLTWQAPDADRWLRWDNGSNFDAIGLTNGGTFEASARFPSSVMIPLIGKDLTEVEIYINDLPTSCVIKIYGQGTTTTPGSLLYSEDVTSQIVGTSFNTITLTTPVSISGYDIWIGYEATHAASLYPCGVDAGPMVTNGGFIYAGGWTTLAAVGLNYNWNIAGFVTSGGPRGTERIALVPKSEKNFNEATVSLSKDQFKKLTSNNGLFTLVSTGSQSISDFANYQLSDRMLGEIRLQNGVSAIDALLTGYNVYRNGVIQSSNQAGTSYNDLGLAYGLYSYTVTAQYNQGESAAIGPVNAAVVPPPASIPFTEGFESWPDNTFVINGTQTNQWYVGTVSTPHTGTNAAYVSNDGGTSYAYTITAGSAVHMFRDITFSGSVGGGYTLKFWWKGMGESGYDFLKVFLVETSVVPTAGVQLTTGQIGLTQYNNQADYVEATVLLPESLTGTTKRLVFSWRNDPSVGTQPPISLDDISVTVTQTGDLNGTVTDCASSSPLQGALVTAGAYSTTTNASGFYQFLGLPNGTYDITASIYGYSSTTVTGVLVPAGTTTTQNLCLNESLLPPSNLQASVTGQDVQLTWVAPPDNVLRWDGPNEGNAIGVGGATFETSVRFDGSITGTMAGKELREMEIYIGAFPTAPTNVTIKIYDEGTPTSPGTSLHSEDVTAQIVANSWNTITITPAITLSGNDIWIGYEVSGGDFPAGCDEGPMVYPDGQWTYLAPGPWAPLSDLAATLTVNWNIAGLVYDAGPSANSKPIVLSSNTSTENNEVNLQRNTSEMNNAKFSSIKEHVNNNPLNKKSYSRFAQHFGGGVTDGTLTGYNVYRDAVEIAHNVPNLFYNDNGLAYATYSYTVTGQYAEGESPAAGPVIATVVNPNLVTVNVYPMSAQYWTGNTEGTIKTDGEINTVYPNVGWASFDLSSIPSSATISSVIFHGYVNATYFPYWSATPMGTVNPVVDDATLIYPQINNNSGSGVAYIYSNEGSGFTPGWHSYTMINTAVSDLQGALAQGWFAVGFVDRDGVATYYVNFDGWSQTNPPYLEVQYLTGGTTTFPLSVNVTQGWNMVSAPGTNPAGMEVGTWWTHKTGTVWGFNGVQYVAATDATPGKGYWMKNTLAETYNYPAITIVTHNPVPVTLGWNLVGGYETSPTITSLKAANPQITGTVWGFNGTQYVAATNLVPGYGYWVKVTSAGNITIPDALAKGNEEVALFKEDWGRIILTDAAGLSYTLYSVKGEVDLNQYEMPPMPPAGMFDIRFNSGRIAEDINSSMQTIDMVGITYPLTVRVEGMDIRLMDETGKTVNVNLKSGESVAINDATIEKLMVSSELMPTVYSLEQNYPNPFNPSTVIEFSLPEDVSNVKLSIYNALGEKVAELVNTNLTAGRYSYQWNAKNVATGMYIYELRTDKFVSVKKMLLLK
jgi:hypothetical protein